MQGQVHKVEIHLFQLRLPTAIERGRQLAGHLGPAGGQHAGQQLLVAQPDGLRQGLEHRPAQHLGGHAAPQGEVELVGQLTDVSGAAETYYQD